VAERIRFHLDENVNPVIAAALRRQGIDVTTTIEMNLRMTSDDEQLEFIRSEARVLVTHDTDFLRIASQTDDHPGIAFSHKDTVSTGQIIRSLVLIYEALDPEEMAGRVEFLSHS
jgi:predicted nuclease of predicted toxin-antitoxin system